MVKLRRKLPSLPGLPRLERIHSCGAGRKQLSGVQSCQSCHVGAHRDLGHHCGHGVWIIWYLGQEGHGKVIAGLGWGRGLEVTEGQGRTGCPYAPTLLTRHGAARKSETQHGGTRRAPSQGSVPPAPSADQALYHAYCKGEMPKCPMHYHKPGTKR